MKKKRAPVCTLTARQLLLVEAEEIFGRTFERAPIWVFALIERDAVRMAARHGVDPRRILTIDGAYVPKALARARAELAARIYNAFPHRAMLARAFGVSRDTMRDWLRRAEDGGWVRPRASADEAAA